jgi:hypothetical protein
VTSLLTERFGAPATTRDGRVHAFERERAIDTLAGRTVWCASALPTGRSRAQDLHRCLEWTGDGGVAADPLDVPVLPVPPSARSTPRASRTPSRPS